MFPACRLFTGNTRDRYGPRQTNQLQIGHLPIHPGIWHGRNKYRHQHHQRHEAGRSWELAEHGVTVNSVAPGFVLSNPSTRRQWEGYSEVEQARIIESIHCKRLGTAEDIAAAVLFFASDAAAWISGQVLSVDGGRS